jgi:hypothetical protein
MHGWKADSPQGCGESPRLEPESPRLTLESLRLALECSRWQKVDSRGRSRGLGQLQSVVEVRLMRCCAV